MRRFLASLIRRGWDASGFWALADQGVVSLGTFLTSVMLARTLSPAEYGIYALICGVFNFLNSLHSALIIVPLITKGASADESEIRRLATGSMVLTGLLIPPLAAVVVAATWAIGRLELAPWAVVAMILWQFQETIRRVFMTRLKHREAMWGDLISYLGQAAVIWVYSNWWQLSVETALILMAATSGTAGLIQVVQHGLRRIEPADLGRLANTCWETGRWVLMTNFAGVFLSQAYPWMLAFGHGAAAAARFQAVGNILGISHPVAFGIGGLIYPAVAKARSERGEREAIRVGFSYGIHGGMLLLPFYLILVLRPQWSLQLFYGADSPYLDLSWILCLFVLYYSISYLANFMVVILNSLERTRVAFFSQLSSALTTIFIGLPLTAWGGVTGATAGSALTSLTRLLASGFFLMQTRATPNQTKNEVSPCLQNYQ